MVILQPEIDLITFGKTLVEDRGWRNKEGLETIKYIYQWQDVEV